MEPTTANYPDQVLACSDLAPGHTGSWWPACNHARVPLRGALCPASPLPTRTHFANVGLSAPANAPCGAQPTGHPIPTAEQSVQGVPGSTRGHVVNIYILYTSNDIAPGTPRNKCHTTGCESYARKCHWQRILVQFDALPTVGVLAAGASVTCECADRHSRGSRALSHQPYSPWWMKAGAIQPGRCCHIQVQARDKKDLS